MICPACGSENAESAKFCSECGTAFAAAPPREERKVVTVLFADLVGFTARAEQLDPEEVRALLQPYHARLREILERHGGTVEKFIGDAVMAVFGAPSSHEDDPERAVRAALAIRDAIVEEGRLQVRIGITTGEALVALGARPAAGEGMAAGDVVNTAARLQAGAPVDGVLVDETTYRATSPAVRYGEAQTVPAKGKEEPVTAFEALEARSRLGLDVAERATTPLVGRAHEVGLLGGLLDRVRSERVPQLVTLVGVPGIGKSRLVLELFRRVADDPELIAWRQGRSLPYGEGSTLWALAEMVKAQAGILENDTAASAGTKLAEAVGDALSEPREAVWVERHLEPLVGLGGELDLGGDRREEAFAAWRRFFEGVAERGPLVLVFEDLQWADDGLLDFVDHLVDWSADVPLLVVGTARPELLSRRPNWGGGKPNATTHSLAALTDQETARLVHALLDRAVLPVEAQRSLVENAGGNPLYAEEFARMLAERASAGAAGDVPLPETVQGIIAARLDGLDAHEKALAQDAAVVGKVFWVGALTAIGGGERWEVERRLHELERRELVRRERQSAVDGERQYAFRHLLLREVAYGQIPRTERAEKHGLAGEWIESLSPDRTDDRAEMLAHHFRAALEYARAAGRETPALVERARDALVEAADRALSLNAFAAAVELYSDAFTLASDGWQPAPRLRLRYGRALDGAGDEHAEQALADALDALLAAGDRENAALAEALISRVRWYVGDGSGSWEHLGRALDLVRDEPPSAAKAHVLSQASSSHMVAEESEEAIRLGREALAIAEELGLAEIQAHALDNIGAARMHARDPGGVEDLERAIAIGLAANSSEAARACINLAVHFMREGELGRVHPLLEQARDVATRFGSVHTLRFLRGNGAINAVLAGRWDEAARLTEETIAEVEAGTPQAGEGTARIVRAYIRLARSNEKGAVADVRRAVELARGRDRANLMVSLAHCACVLVDAGEGLAEARSLGRELLGLVRGDPQFRRLAQLIALQAPALGLAAEVREVLGDPVAGEIRWITIGRATVDGDLVGAAEILAALPDPFDAARTRMFAAERLVAEGRGAEANEQLDRALEFWHSVGATRYIAEAEALRAQAATA